MTAFGREIKSKHFLLDPNVTFCNHGSYGTVPRPVFKRRLELLEEQEKNPELWFRESSENYYLRSIGALADFLNAKPDRLILMPNATTAINTVVRNLKLSGDDTILINSHTYAAVVKTVEGLPNVKIQVLEYPKKITGEQEIVDLYIAAVDDNPSIRLTIIDHISSATAILFPVEKIILELRKRSVMVCVDGAHAPGHLTLDMENIKADFYTGNLHKWCFTPRGVAFLYVGREYVDELQPLVTSHFGDLDLQRRFAFLGTDDLSAYYTVPDALAFLKSLGWDERHDYIVGMLDEAAEMIAKTLNTTVLWPESMRAPHMRLIKTPDWISKSIKDSRESDAFVLGRLYKKHKIVSVFPVCGESVYLRISGDVYNCAEDYKRLRDALVQELLN